MWVNAIISVKLRARPQRMFLDIHVLRSDSGGSIHEDMVKPSDLYHQIVEKCKLILKLPSELLTEE